jgi:RES domain-containing protein
VTSLAGNPLPIVVAPHPHPLYRLVRAKHPDAMDTSYSQRSGGRWNPKGTFPVLYTACSVRVARAIVRDLFAAGLVDPEDLMPGEQPELAHVAWSGQVVDVAAAAGVAAAGFVADYPRGVGHAVTQPKGVAWHAGKREGVVCRSASEERLGRTDWSGDCSLWGETAIFIDKAATQPRQLRRQGFAEWW